MQQCYFSKMQAFFRGDAARCMHNSDLTITNIARSVGYEDSLYFSRLFRRKKGQTPSQYRSTHQSPESNS